MSHEDDALTEIMNMLGEVDVAKEHRKRKHRPNISHECARHTGHVRCIDHDCECECHE